jgi:hypothetical protein
MSASHLLERSSDMPKIESDAIHIRPLHRDRRSRRDDAGRVMHYIIILYQTRWSNSQDMAIALLYRSSSHRDSL